MFSTISGFVLTILSILIIIIFGGSIYAFFYAIFLFIFSAGDPDKIKKAWNSIRFMILGIILTIAFLFIFPLIFKRIQLPGYEIYTANNIFQHAGELTKMLFGFSKEAVLEYQDGEGYQLDNPGSNYNTPNNGSRSDGSPTLEL